MSKSGTPSCLSLLVVFTFSSSATPQTRARGVSEGDRARIQARFDELEADVDNKKTELGPRRHSSLLETLQNAERSFLEGLPCDAEKELRRFLTAVGRIRLRSRTELAEQLYNLGWMLRRAVLLGAPDSDCADSRIDREPRVVVRRSSTRRFHARVELGEPRLSTIVRGDELWTRVFIPGLQPEPEQIGLPAIPHFRSLVAVPNGARPSFSGRGLKRSRFKLNLYPVQGQAPMQRPSPDDYFDELPPDEAFDDPAFVKDEEAFLDEIDFPREICSSRLLGRFRDLNIAEVDCAAGQYNAVSDRLTLFGALDLRMEFEGGDGTFITDRSRSPFESAPALYRDAVLNRAAVARFVDPAFVPLDCYGEELVILTHADLRAAADELAQWKNAKGILTSVFEVNDGPGGPRPDTPAAIRDFVTNRYDTCTVRPSYVLLFGDAEYVPTFYQPNPIEPGNYIASDFPYSVYVQFAGDFGLDFAVARIPVDPENADVVVDKIVKYEVDPPGSLLPIDFYKAVSIASQFECCQIDDPTGHFPPIADGTDQRAFIEVVEDVRTRLEGFGYDVERIYTETIDGQFDGDPTPRFYAWGGDLPVELQPPFPWDGSKQDIVNAYHAGRFLMIHLDHGSSHGWAHPQFVRPDAEALVNGELLPVVLGYNCSSGYFDNETDGPPNDPSKTFDPTLPTYVNFTEQLIRNPLGGAIGSIAATRTTYAHGNIMIKGAIDSALPGMDTAFGSSEPNRRLGDMLNHGRMYMLASYGGGDWTNAHFLLYLAFGDPTLEMWTSSPYKLPEIPVLVEIFPDFLRIPYEFEGAVLTALQETGEGLRPIGRAVVQNGVAELRYVRSPVDGGRIFVSASAANGVSVQLPTVRNPGSSGRE